LQRDLQIKRDFIFLSRFRILQAEMLAFGDAEIPSAIAPIIPASPLPLEE